MNPLLIKHMLDTSSMPIESKNSLWSIGVEDKPDDDRDVAMMIIKGLFWITGIALVASMFMPHRPEIIEAPAPPPMPMPNITIQMPPAPVAQAA